MVTFEELVGKFGIVNVTPYGACIIVPGDEFDPDWEVALADQGCRFHFVDLGGKAVTLVQKGKKSEGSGEKPVYEPPTTEESHKVVTKEPQSSRKVATEEDLKTATLADFPWTVEDEQKLLRRMNELEGTVYERAAVLMPEFQGRSAVALRQKFYKLTGLKAGSKRKARPRPELLHTPWTAKEDELLVELWNKRMKRAAIAAKVSGRSEEAVQNRLGVLQDLGRIKPRWKQKLKIPERKAEKEPKDPAGSELTPTPVHAPTSTPMRNASEDLAVGKLIKTLDALTDVVDKLSCNAVMHALEIRELKSKDDFKIPLGLWTAYSNALLEGDKKYRDVFRDKVRKLLEASE